MRKALLFSGRSNNEELFSHLRHKSFGQDMFIIIILIVISFGLLGGGLKKNDYDYDYDYDLVPAMPVYG